MLQFVRVCCTLWVCTSFFADKGLQSACSLRSLRTPFPNGSVHALSLTVSSDISGVAREGPEATPVTSHASTF